MFFSWGCSITKRVYQPGYHVEWKNNKYELTEVKSNHSSSNSYVQKSYGLTLIPNEDFNTLASIKTPPSKTSESKNKSLIGLQQKIEKSKHKILKKKIIPKKVKTIFSYAMKGVNLQEPSGQLFLLGILSLIFIGLGVTLLYFTTPPQINTGYVCLLIGTICLVAFLRILAGIFAEWAFG